MSKNPITGPMIKPLQSINKRPVEKPGKFPSRFLPMPDDLENQVLSKNPLERERQLDQQEADRIERTEG